MTGGKTLGGDVVQGGADLAGGRVEVVLGPVTVEADRVGAAAEAGQLAEQVWQGAR